MSQTPEEEAAGDQDAGPASQPSGAAMQAEPDEDQDAGAASEPEPEQAD
jgi:hypothetical protein